CAPISVPMTAAVGHSVDSCIGAPVMTLRRYSLHPPSSDGPSLICLLRGLSFSFAFSASRNRSLRLVTGFLHVHGVLHFVCNRRRFSWLVWTRLFWLDVEWRFWVDQNKAALDERSHASP